MMSKEMCENSVVTESSIVTSTHVSALRETK